MIRWHCYLIARTLWFPGQSLSVKVLWDIQPMDGWIDGESRYKKVNLSSCISPQGCLLLYGTYLAGLTSNVSHPPVNQSPTILTVVTLATISSTVALPVSIFLQAWPNVVYSTVAGAIFICTLATNCMLFIPQVRKRWHKTFLQMYNSVAKSGNHCVYDGDIEAHIIALKQKLWKEGSTVT